MKTKISLFFILIFFAVFPIASHADTSQSVGVDLKINGLDGPINMSYGAVPVLTWTSTGIGSCSGYQNGSATTTTGWQGGLGTSGTISFENIISNTFFSITCSDSSGTTVSDSVSVFVKPFVRPSVNGVVSKEPGGALIPGKTAYVIGQGFLPLPAGNIVNIATSLDTPSSVTAPSEDGNTISFIVPEDLSPKLYNFWVSNWNGMSNYSTVIIAATTTPVQATSTVSIPPTITTITTQPITTSLVSALCVAPSVDVKYGSRDILTKGGVSLLQKVLNEKGYLNSTPTGYFGLLTLSAVKKFQIANGISGTGYVGPLTRTKIAKLSCIK